MIVLILHEASLTGAPRLGALIARELAQHQPCRLLVMKDGPLTPWLKQVLGADNVTIAPPDTFAVTVPFAERVQRAKSMLVRLKADVIYVNSLASSVFALAAQGQRVILHVHEQAEDMRNLLFHDVTKVEVLRVVDRIVLAAPHIREDLCSLFALRYALPPLIDFGVAIDVEATREAAKARVPAPCNALGQGLRAGSRLLVGMCGHASPRKGVDVFFHTAQAMPEHNFLWIGGFFSHETDDNIIYDDFLRVKLPNFYVTGVAHNPYPHLAALDVFFLSSREDPNPLVLGEALALHIPVLAFSGSTGIGERLGRWATLCYGEVNLADAQRVLCQLSKHTLIPVDDAYLADYDLKAKMPALIEGMG